MALKGQNLAGRAQQSSKWVRPLLPLGIIVIAAIVLLYLGSFVAMSQGATADAELPWTRWVGVIVGGAVIIYGLYVWSADRPIWNVGTREVVYMGIGAALYGVLSWATNVFQLPSISLVALRPAIVIPVFFGVTFGPVVGFFSGFVGNVLGDALTGWGVYPLWDVGNGLLGLIAGLILVFRDPRQSLDVLTAVIAVVALLATGLILLNADATVTTLSGEEIRVGALWWLPLLAGALVVGTRFALARRIELAAPTVWGALGIILGIGFAAFGGIIQNGTSPGAALFGEFVPAAGTNLINTAILLPILITAWTSARARSGR